VTDEEARARFGEARVARLATADAQGQPHLVPLVFAVEGERIYSVVDHKPKRSKALRRLANVRENPRVCLLVDHYADDWSTLWWVRADGTARVLDAAEDESTYAVSCLARRYPQYVAQPPDGEVLVVDVTRWSWWEPA
jgi:PPOX class probable F420-dependent enzyme